MNGHICFKIPLTVPLRTDRVKLDKNIKFELKSFIFEIDLISTATANLS